MFDPTRPIDDSAWLRGWTNIAQFVQRSEKTVRKYSQWGTEGRLPVFVDHRGPFAHPAALRQWMLDQILPAGVRERLKKRVSSRHVPAIPLRAVKANGSAG